MDFLPTTLEYHTSVFTTLYIAAIQVTRLPCAALDYAWFSGYVISHGFFSKVKFLLNDDNFNCMLFFLALFFCSGSHVGVIQTVKRRSRRVTLHGLPALLYHDHVSWAFGRDGSRIANRKEIHP
jgi:hypothetical protein